MYCMFDVDHSFPEQVHLSLSDQAQIRIFIDVELRATTLALWARLWSVVFNFKMFE